MKPPRKELVGMFVLDAVADDYENFEKIASTVEDFARRCGLPIALPELLEAVEDLVRSGLVKAYRLSPTKPVEEVSGVPQRSEIHSCYFWVTEAGAAVQAAEYDGWPFDEHGELKSDWCAPD